MAQLPDSRVADLLGIQRNFEAANAASNSATSRLTVLERTAPVAVSTSLPTSPVDGQRVLIQTATMATAGIVWEFRYRAASTSPYKWEFVGGSGFDSEIITTESRAAGATFGDLATVGPSVTLPFAGDYDITFGVGARNDAAGGYAVVGPSINGATPGSAALAYFLAAIANQEMTVHRVYRRTLTTANSTVRLQYQSTVGTTFFLRRNLQVVPVRVG